MKKSSFLSIVLGSLVTSCVVIILVHQVFGHQNLPQQNQTTWVSNQYEVHTRAGHRVSVSLGKDFAMFIFPQKLVSEDEVIVSFPETEPAIGSKDPVTVFKARQISNQIFSLFHEVKGVTLCGHVLYLSFSPDSPQIMHWSKEDSRQIAEVGFFDTEEDGKPDDRPTEGQDEQGLI